MKFCKSCNQVINIDNILLHLDHEIIEKTFDEIYREAVEKTKRY